MILRYGCSNVGEMPRGSWTVTGIWARTRRGLPTPLCLLVLCLLSEALCQEGSRDGRARPAKGIPEGGGQNVGISGGLSSAAMGMTEGAEPEGTDTGGRRAGSGGMVSGIMTIKGYTDLSQVGRIRNSAHIIPEACKQSPLAHALLVHVAPAPISYFTQAVHKSKTHNGTKHPQP
jgi:hypothetical protein